MKCLIITVLCALMALSVTEGSRQRRSDKGRVVLRSIPKVALQGVTENLKLECRANPSAGVVDIPILIALERIDESGNVTIVAARTLNSEETSVRIEANRTSAEATLGTSEAQLTVTITEPTEDDAGIYGCRYFFLDKSLVPDQLAAKINVTVTSIPPPDYSPDLVASSDCDCDLIWEEINQIKASLGKRPSNPQSGDDSCQSSFSARFESRQGYLIIGDQPAIFDYVISNKGEAYDKATGSFTAPCAGHYFFSVTLRSNQDMDSGYVDGVIEVDGEPRARTSVYTSAPIDNYQSATNGVVLELKEGQNVKVIVRTTSSGQFVGDEYSVFSGFYLHQ